VNKKKQRTTIRARKQRQKRKSRLIWGSVIVVVIVLIGFLAWNETRPLAGESTQIMANASEHVSEGDDPGPFNTDPPTSGRHYASDFEAGFYEPSDPQVNVTYPEGYLVHNLEHGYVIYWYNCDLLDESECAVLKGQIKASMKDNGGTKLIGFPRASIDAPLVMTTWGQMQRFETFDEGLASKFVKANRNHAPEPNAP
jgi:hypothetical protein